MNARRQVASSAVISFMVLAAAEQQRTQSLPPVNQLISFAFVFFVLSALADFNVQASGGFAVLAMVAIILSQGEDALKFIQARMGQGKKK